MYCCPTCRRFEGEEEMKMAERHHKKRTKMKDLNKNMYLCAKKMPIGGIEDRCYRSYRCYRVDRYNRSYRYNRCKDIKSKNHGNRR